MDEALERLDDGAGEDDQNVHPIFRRGGDPILKPTYPILPLLSPTSENAQHPNCEPQQNFDGSEDMLDDDYCDKVLAGLDPSAATKAGSKPTSGQRSGGHTGGSEVFCHQRRQAGHVKRDCPQKKAPGAPREQSGGDDKKNHCYTFGQAGHTNRNCSQDIFGAKGGNDRSGITCDGCGKDGHTQRDCRQGNRGRGRGGRRGSSRVDRGSIIICHNCNKTGHTQNDCRQGRGGGARGGGNRVGGNRSGGNRGGGTRGGNCGRGRGR